MDGIAKVGPKPGLKLLKLDEPKIGPTEVLVETIASSICGTDIHLYNWDHYCDGLRMSFPRVIGHETVGRVTEVGRDVENLRVGDLVSAESHLFCDSCRPCKSGHRELCSVDRILGEDSNGAFAQFLALDARFLWKHHSDIDVRLACVSEPLGNAVNMVVKAELASKVVLISGAGPIGLFSTVLARHYGAADTIVVEPTPLRRSLAKDIGASVVLDPSAQEVSAVVSERTGGVGVDVCLEISGTVEGLRTCLDAIRPGGTIIAFGLYDGMVEVDLTRKLVLRGVSLVGVTGRRVWQTWEQTSNLINCLGNGLRKVITDEYDYTDYELAFAQLGSKQCAKILFWFKR